MTLTINEVIAKFPQEVLDRYDFSKAEYHGALIPITGIICRVHGEFKQYAAQLRKGGSGCPKCGGEVRAAKKRLSPEEYIRRATEAHNGYYTYERTEFFNTTQPITVTCPKHGDFTISPNNHLYSEQGCPACGSISRGHRKDPKAAGRIVADGKIASHALKFEEEARKVHGDAYDYSKSVYRGRKQLVEIVCPKHGSFHQRAEHHLYRAQGCPECSHHRSKGESAIVEFVSIFTKPLVRDRKTIAPYELDIYIPEHNLAIEYCGEYWHGTKSEEDERQNKNRHYDKFKACEAKGIRLLTVYESEWLDHPEVIKRLIRNAIDKGRGSLMARKCEINGVSHKDAATFFDKYHPQGGGGSGVHYGLFHNDKLVACMRFTLGANDRGVNADRVWTLSRYATRVSVTGGASRLLKAFLEDHKPESIKSFSDNRYFTGALYSHLGFVLEEHTAPDYQVWHQKLGLLPKTAWQRKALPARIRELGADERFEPDTDPRSERQMTFALGARRVFDCGKKRWMLRSA